MDHVLLPLAPLHRPQPVLLSSKEDIPFREADLEGWADVPDEYGWTWPRVNKLKKQTKCDHEFQDLQEFLQGWLFFALLKRFLGTLYVRDDFIAILPSGELALSTARLIPLLQAWSSHQKAVWPWLKTDGEREKQCAALRVDLEDAWTWLYGLEKFELAAEAGHFTTLLLSIECLCKTLEHTVLAMVTVHYRGDTPNISQDLPWHIPSRPWTPNTVITRTMASDGWCPWSIARVADMLGGTALYYVSQLVRYGSVGQHKGCSQDACMARKLDKDTYKPKHVAHCNSCDDIGPDMQSLYRILDDGGLPVLRIDATQAGPPVVQVADHRLSGPYVAFSHVISDGWGNFQDNAMPTCQLFRLQKLVNDLSGGRNSKSTSFWIDTICVPLNEASPSHHIIAMERMRTTYAAATSVLVLDAELMSTPQDLPLEELQMRIATCDWMSRLWCLQEGILTHSAGLYFQFKEGARLFDTTFSRELIHESPFKDLASKVLVWTSILQLQNIIGLADFSIPLATRFGVLVSLFRGRSTSIQLDVPYVFSNMLGIDPSPLLRLAHSTSIRQKALTGLLPHWPQNILFHTGPRLPEYGYRYFLSSFSAFETLSKTALGSLRTEPSYLAPPSSSLGAVITGRGLLTTYPAYDLDLTDVEMSNSFDIFIEETDTYIHAGALFADVAFGTNRFPDIAPKPGHCRMGFLQRDEELTPGKNNPAILVSVVDEDAEEAIVYCKYEWRMGFGLLDAEAKAKARDKWMHMSDRDVRKNTKMITATKSRSKWCVG